MKILSVASGFIFPLWLKIVLLLAVVSGYSWFWYNMGWNARDRDALNEKVEQIEKAEEVRKETQNRYDDVSSRLQDALSNVRVETKYVDRVITKEIEKPIYSACVLPDTGKVILNDNATRLNNLRK